MTAAIEEGPLISEMRLRISQAARMCAHVSNRAVILPEPVQVFGCDLSSLLMGMSIDVFHGHQVNHQDLAPPTIVSIGRLKCSSMKCRISLIKSFHPMSALCVITGLLESSTYRDGNCNPDYDDVRTCLFAAGIGFLSEYEALDAAEA
jgi:hypothetical protein